MVKEEFVWKRKNQNSTGSQMHDLEEKLRKADRLATIAQRIGVSLWQLQELEGVTAQYLVLLTQAKKGMGRAAASDLLDKAQRKTFGVTVGEIVKAHLLRADLEARFTRVLAKRNWLVHNSRSPSRDAVESDNETIKLVARIDAIASESLQLLRKIGALVEDYVKQQGVSQEYIDQEASKILRKWRSGVGKDD